MKSKRKINYKLKILVILLILLINTTLITNFIKNQTQNGLVGIGSNNNKKSNKETSVQVNKSLKPSEIVYHSQKYNLSDWWNKTYNYRIGLELEELDSVHRYQPVDVYLTFRENEHHENTTRLVSYNATGNNEWSKPIPIQVWNVEKYQSTNFIQSCTISFIANVTANSNRTYFLYFNDAMDNINALHYDTNFSSILSDGKLNVSVGKYESQYNVLIEEGFGVSKLIRNNTNFHSKDSLTPQRQLVHSSLNLLAHCDEGAGNKVSDSSGNDLEGDFVGNTGWGPGKVNMGLVFDGNGDYITFDDVLNSPFGSTSKAFTITTWIKPKALTSSESTHKTMNCFMAKASEQYNDNFELGIYKVNNTHGLLHIYINTQNFDTNSTYGNELNNPILINQWNFIAVKYDEGNVDVRINNVWYTKDINNTEPWEGATYLNQASGSHFTIGATLNNNTYFNGTMDEIAVYNVPLSNNEIELNKLAYRNSSIESITEIENGEVFSRYQVDWTEIYDMHIQDIITFYYDYNLWNTNRSIYFDNPFDSAKSNFYALNTFYNFSEAGNHQECKYIYDGIVKKDITSTGFIVENYTIIHNAFNASKDTIGIFIAGYNVSDYLQSSINELKGDIFYTNKTIEYIPGSINDFDNNIGGEEFKLHISFWEFINTVNQSGDLNDTKISQYFNDILVSLRNSLRVHIFHQETPFFNLEIYIEDIDKNPVNRATISLYNLTYDGKIDTCIASQNTRSNGKTSFLHIENGTYTVNISYKKYNQPAFQIIPNVINITINETEAGPFGWIYYNFFNVSLTSLKMTFQVIDIETHEIEKPAVNANVSFWINDGSGNKYIGYELTDDLGMAEFYWSNFTAPEDGNLTFAVIWHDELHDITTEKDLVVGNPQNITLFFYKEDIITVNVSSYKFSTALVEYIPENLYLGEEIPFKVNYSYTINYTNPMPISEAEVSYYIKQGGVNLSSTLIEFNETIINGTYETKINTSNPEDPEITFLAGVPYRMVIRASKAGYIPASTTILFEFLLKSTNLTSDHNELEVYWNENITLNVYYENLYAVPHIGIDGATVDYSVVGIPNINGYLISNGTDGWYKLDLNSTKFGNVGSYNMKITAYKRGYEITSIILSLKILLRPTLINGKQELGPITHNIYWGDIINFTFSYKDNLTSELITNIANQSFIWEMYDLNGKFIKKSQDNLILDKNNEYVLDFNTESRNIGFYTFFLNFSKEDYSSKLVEISLKINYRGFYPELGDQFKDRKASISTGDTLTIHLYIHDAINNKLVNGAKIEINYGGETYYFEEIEIGHYIYKFYTDDYDTLFFPKEILCDISIYGKFSYLNEYIEITVVVEREEIIPGVPLIFYIVFVVIISTISGIFFSFLYLKKKKKIMDLIKDFKLKFRRKHRN